MEGAGAGFSLPVESFGLAKSLAKSLAKRLLEDSVA